MLCSIFDMAHDLLLKSAEIVFCGRMYGIEYAVKLYKKKRYEHVRIIYQTMRRDIMEKQWTRLLLKARGFVYPGSEIYGVLVKYMDYGNLGADG